MDQQTDQQMDQPIDGPMDGQKNPIEIHKRIFKKNTGAKTYDCSLWYHWLSVHLGLLPKIIHLIFLLIQI